jgi:hypothetical protein
MQIGSIYMLPFPARSRGVAITLTVVRTKQKTFGQYPAMSLADARMAHVKFRDLQDAPASDTAPTFKKVAEAWLKIKLPTLSNPKHQL